LKERKREIVMKRKWLYFMFFALDAVLMACMGLAAFIYYLAYSRVPNHTLSVVHRSLTAPVSVIRDDWGVPHIKADTETDAYFVLGYVMAQDRLFQMELVLRLAGGELAEILGPPAVPIDKLARTFQLRAHAAKYLKARAEERPEIKAAADAFVAGINHRVDREALPFEFAVLRIPKRHYTPEDCLTVAAILPISFAEGLRSDPLYSLIEERFRQLGIQRNVQDLFPGYSKETPITVMETIGEAEAFLAAKQPQARGAADAAGGEALRAFLDSAATLSRLFGPSLGSNSWVLGPSRTESGKPILANDPHIALTNPGVWYEAHLIYGEINTYGYFLPLIPFALIGHNGDYAWALTMFENDDVDLYRETFDPNDPGKVMYKGQWTDVRTTTETIRVRFGRDQTIDVRNTPHGPIITDLFRTLHKYEGPDIALSWVWQHTQYTDMEALYDMNHARTMEQFGAALAKITSPGLNVSYADRAGNIAWWAAGLLPIRPRHVNPKCLLDGASGDDDILGYVPFDANPHLINPPSGCIVSANNKSTVKPVGPIQDLEGYWQPTDRAGRIEQLLDAREKWNLNDLRAVQLDDVAYNGPRMVGAIANALKPVADRLNPLQRQALELLNSWDFGHDKGSAGAALFQVLCDELLDRILSDELGADYLGVFFMCADHWNFFKYVLENPESPYWDNCTTSQVETRTDIVLNALEAAVGKLARLLGPDMAQWTWGAIHVMEFKHPFGYLPLLGRIFNIGPFPAAGGSHLVNNMLYSRGKWPYKVVAGPSTRRLIDFADPAHSLTVLPTGNGGNFMGLHYDDQAALFMAGQYREPHFLMEEIKKHMASAMIFLPGDSAGNIIPREKQIEAPAGTDLGES